MFACLFACLCLLFIVKDSKKEQEEAQQQGTATTTNTLLGCVALSLGSPVPPHHSLSSGIPPILRSDFQSEARPRNEHCHVLMSGQRLWELFPQNNLNNANNNRTTNPFSNHKTINKICSHSITHKYLFLTHTYTTCIGHPLAYIR